MNTIDGVKGPTKNNFPFWDADPSRLAALLVGHISRYHSLLVPCQPGASTFSVRDRNYEPGH